MDEMVMNVESLWLGLQTFFLSKGLDVLGAALVLAGGWLVGHWLRQRVIRWIERGPVDSTLASFFGGLAYAGLMLIAFIAAASVVGVPLAPAVALLGAAGLAIALAFQGTLSNFAAGVMILSFRPFHVGDWVELAGDVGRVTEVSLFSTMLTTGDNVRIIVPNSEVFGSTIKNLTANATRRIDLVIGVGYDDDLGTVIRTVRDVLAAEDRVLPDPEPVVAVSEMGDSSVNLVVRPWVATGDYWPTRWDLTRALKESVEAAGCSIPYPQRDVHLFRESGDAA